MRRGLAVLAALALVALALVVRAVIDDDGGDAGDEPISVACIAELVDACEAVDGLRVVGTDEDPVAVVTFESLPDAPEAPVAALASTAVVLVARGDATDCTDWVCAAAELGRRAVLPSPATATGLLVLAEAVTDHFGGPFASNDFDGALDDFVTTLDVADDPVEDMSSSFGQAGPLVSGGLLATLEPLLAQPGFVGLSLHPTGARARAVIVGDDVPDDVVDDLADALADAGWDPSVAEPTGLPGAGVLFALAQRYETLRP